MGISQTGSLIAFWPFTEAPAVYHMEPGTANSWFRFVKDTPDIATFTALSNWCLQLRSSGKSMAECLTQSGGQGTTALSTQAMLDPDSLQPSVGTVYWIDDMYLTTEKVWKTETSQGILARTGGNWCTKRSGLISPRARSWSSFCISLLVLGDCLLLPLHPV